MASWEWKAKDAWTPYDHKANKKIIKAAKNGKSSVEITLPSGAKYLIDLVNYRQIQKNAPTKTRRVRYNDGSLPRTKPKTIKKVTETTTITSPGIPVTTQTVGGNMFYTSTAPGTVVSTVSTAAPMQPMQTMQPVPSHMVVGAPQPQFAQPPTVVHTQAPPPYYNPQMAPQAHPSQYAMPIDHAPSSHYLPQHQYVSDPNVSLYQPPQAITATGIEWNQQRTISQHPPGY